MVVGLGLVHALGVFPSEVAHQSKEWDDHRHEVEDWGGEEARYDACVFGGEAQFRCYGRVGGDEAEPDHHAAWNGDECVFGPDVGDEGGLAEHSCKDSSVESSSPDPMAGYPAVILGRVPEPDEFGDKVCNERVVEAVEDPGEEGVHFEEHSSLAKLVKLGVAVEEARRNELVENTHDEGREDGEEDIVERQGPGFEDDLAGE